MNRGDVELGEKLSEEALALSREIHHQLAEEFALMNVAMAAFARGDIPKAEAFMEQGLVSRRRRGDTNMVAYCLHNLGYGLAFHGEHERAAAVTGEAFDLFRSLDNRQSISISLTNLGMAALGRGDAETAWELAVESLTINQELGASGMSFENLEILAGVAGLEGEATRAAGLWGSAEALREAAGFSMPSNERALREGYVALSRSQLGETLWQEARMGGRALTLEEALAYALEPTEERTSREDDRG